MNKLLKNKRGKSEDLIYWFFYLPLTAVVVIIIATSANTLLSQTTSTHNLEYYTYSKRVINALSYGDDIHGRLFTGIMDPLKFNEQTLQTALDRENYIGKEFGIKIQLDYFDETKQDAIIYYNEEGYDISKIFYRVVNEYYVLVKSEEEFKQAKLTIDLAYHKKRYPD
ncbi:hypothetical protein CEE44_02460 [Candidatus Woesearchaeota archaeon B3_Woes]|nr:MAG: hypothetical protein CEE44_02460 [Candidatus Woesearchaeota archaeon B3_Woes]